jgi:hypothetical protein
MTLDYSGTESDALGARSDWIGSILDVCANDDGGFGRRRLVQEERCADSEERVWACASV